MENHIKTGIQLNLIEIGKSYNTEYLTGLAMEECAELIQALNKLNRHKYGEYKGKEAELLDHLFEEIADVEICLQILKNKFKCENEVYNWKNQKINRWLKRLKEQMNR